MTQVKLCRVKAYANSAVLNQNRIKNLKIMIIDGISTNNLILKIADGRLNKLEIYRQGQAVTVYRGGNDTKDFHNSKWNRRNYSKNMDDNKIIIIKRRNYLISTTNTNQIYRSWNKNKWFNGHFSNRINIKLP